MLNWLGALASRPSPWVWHVLPETHLTLTCPSLVLPPTPSKAPGKVSWPRQEPVDMGR